MSYTSLQSQLLQESLCLVNRSLLLYANLFGFRFHRDQIHRLFFLSGLKSHRNVANQTLPYHRKRLIAFNTCFFRVFISQGPFLRSFSRNCRQHRQQPCIRHRRRPGSKTVCYPSSHPPLTFPFLKLGLKPKEPFALVGLPFQLPVRIVLFPGLLGIIDGNGFPGKQTF